MSDAAKTKNVFLDTEIFGRQQMHFESEVFQCLIRLAQADEINLFLTTVTEREIRRHIDEKGSEVFKHIKDLRRFSRYVKNLVPPALLDIIAKLDEDAVRKDLHKQFDDFIALTGTEVLPINASPEAVLDKYFKREAPFGSGGKKDEFPDAFAVATLAQWCQDHGDCQIYVVSGDGDFKRACAVSGKLLHVERADELLEIFAEPLLVASIKEGLMNETGELIRCVEEKIGDLSFIVEGDVPDGEIDNVECPNVSFFDIHVLEAKDGHAVVTTTCKMVLSIDAVADDPDSAIKDSETKSLYYVYRMSGTIERDYEKEATIKLDYDPQSPNLVDITDFSFDNKEVYITIEEGELTRDEDYEDPDIYSEEPE